jgi:hypothetical protein
MAGAQVKDMEVALLINSAACQLRLGRQNDSGTHERAKQCLTVLNRALTLHPQNPKALIRSLASHAIHVCLSVTRGPSGIVFAP